MNAPTLAEVKLPYTCRVCEAEKGDGNHWWIAFALREETEDDTPFLQISPWVVMDARWPYAAVACGEKCVHALVSRWLETRTFDAPRPNRPNPLEEKSC